MKYGILTEYKKLKLKNRLRIVCWIIKIKSKLIFTKIIQKFYIIQRRTNNWKINYTRWLKLKPKLRNYLRIYYRKRIRRFN